MGSRSPMMVKAHVSPGLRTKTRPQLEQRLRSDQPANNRPSPQCGHRLRSPRQSAVPIKFDLAVVDITSGAVYLRELDRLRQKLGVAASWMPARSAAKLDPVRTLANN